MDYQVTEDTRASIVATDEFVISKGQVKIYSPATWLSSSHLLFINIASTFTSSYGSPQKKSSNNLRIPRTSRVYHIGPAKPLSHHIAMAATADRSKPFIPLSGIAEDGWSKEDEATATCLCGAVQLVFVSSP